MATLVQQKIYIAEGVKTVRLPMYKMLYLRLIATGTITALGIYLSTPIAVLSEGDVNPQAIFAVRYNGSPILTGANRHTFNLGDQTVIKSGLNQAVSKYGVLTLDLESVSGRGVRIVTLLVDIEV